MKMMCALHVAMETMFCMYLSILSTSRLLCRPWTTLSSIIITLAMRISTHMEGLREMTLSAKACNP